MFWWCVLVTFCGFRRAKQGGLPGHLWRENPVLGGGLVVRFVFLGFKLGTTMLSLHLTNGCVQRTSGLWVVTRTVILMADPKPP